MYSPGVAGSPLPGPQARPASHGEKHPQPVTLVQAGEVEERDPEAPPRTRPQASGRLRSPPLPRAQKRAASRWKPWAGPPQLGPRGVRLHPTNGLVLPGDSPPLPPAVTESPGGPAPPAPAGAAPGRPGLGGHGGTRCPQRSPRARRGLEAPHRAAAAASGPHAKGPLPAASASL